MQQVWVETPGARADRSAPAGGRRGTASPSRRETPTPGRAGSHSPTAVPSVPPPQANGRRPEQAPRPSPPRRLLFTREGDPAAGVSAIAVDTATSRAAAG